MCGEGNSAVFAKLVFSAAKLKSGKKKIAKVVSSIVFPAKLMSKYKWQLLQCLFGGTIVLIMLVK